MLSIQAPARRLLALLSISLVATLRPHEAVAQAAACPFNVFDLSGMPLDSTDAAAAARSGAFSRASYNWSVGTVSSASWASNADHASGRGDIRATDEFSVQGPVEGTDLVILASYRVQAWVQSNAQAYSYGSGRAWAEATGAFPIAVQAVGGLGFSPYVDSTKVLEIPVSVGGSFRLTLGASSSAQDASAGVEGMISFPDLPAGIVIRSCQGLEFAGIPVPARRSTWGDLKAHYR